MSKITAKTVISKSKLPNVQYVYNPYLGCTHACVYCYARFMKRFSPHAKGEWGTFVHWKSNVLDLLPKEIKKVQANNGNVLFGSVTDCYQPIEKKLKLTRSSLEIFQNSRIPVSILTKSSLIQRDFDILTKNIECEVGLSIGVMNDMVAKILEPHASSIEERIETLKMAHKAGIKTYAFIGPIHPFFTDIAQIFEKIYPYTDSVMAEIINLRCGNWENVKFALEKLKINPLEYKNIATSESFIDETCNLIEYLCLKHDINFQGCFYH